ncbi:MAG: hypothetical protein KC656_37065, partial [Myxococcales bacterium]|nr:hypothetical protein [Myxococcales bacterium]
MQSSLPAADDRQGLVELMVAGVDALWRSEEAWNAWPWPTARAAVHEGDRTLLFTFGHEDGVHIEVVPMTAHMFVGDPYGIELDDACTPEVETCDGVDQDCDGQGDNGLCCEIAPNSTSRLFRPSRDVATPPLQFLVSDVERADAYHLGVRVSEDRWLGKLAHMRRDANGSLPDILELERFDIRGAHEGRALVAAGGFNLLV